MNACKRCRWWQIKPGGHYDYIPHQQIVQPLDPDTYEPMVMPFEVRHCTNPKLLFCERPVEKDGFAVADGSTYMANLITAEDFGCVKWEGVPCHPLDHGDI